MYVTANGRLLVIVKSTQCCAPDAVVTSDGWSMVSGSVSGGVIVTGSRACPRPLQVADENRIVSGGAGTKWTSLP